MKTKRCSKCKKMKAVGEFGKARSCKDGLQSYCKECRADYYATHRVEIAARQAAYDAKHRKEKAAYDAAYYATHKVGIAAHSADYYKANPEKCRASMARYKRANPEKIRQNVQKREARKHNLPATLTVKQWQRILLESGNCCTYCDRPFTEENPPVQEHFIPLSKGGAYTKENIVPACRSCNSRKNAKVFKNINEAREYLKGK